MITGSIIHKAWLEANNVTVSPWDALGPRTKATYEGYAMALQGRTYVNGFDLWAAFGNDPAKLPPGNIRDIYQDAAKRINAALLSVSGTPASVYTTTQPVAATPTPVGVPTPVTFSHEAFEALLIKHSIGIYTDGGPNYEAFLSALAQMLQPTGHSPVATETEQPKEIDWLAINAACSGKPRYRKP